MKFIISFLVLGLSLTAQAITSGQFVGPYGIIRVLPRDYTGATDSDAQALYEAMNVPEKNSILGQGKVIESSDEALQFVCANRQQVGFECSIFIHQKANGSLNAAKKSMLYRLVGEEANLYGKLFKTDASGEFHFVSADGVLQVHVGPSLFEVIFQSVTDQFEKGLVVVNVEETLKISHIQNFWDSLNYNTDTKKRYMGMVRVLQLLARKNPGYRFVYLTRPTELVAGKVEREFVINNKFPRGEFKTYVLDTSVESRVGILRKIVSESGVRNVILLGHNGSPDPKVFRAVSKEFQNINFLQYIHVVYSTMAITELGLGLYPEQTGYVTAVELIVDWQLRGLTEPVESLNFARTMVNRVMTEDPAMSKVEELAIPEFVNCDDFQWRWSTAGEFKILSPLRDHLINRCHMQAPLAGY